jgi:hypothetical protein
VGRSIAATGIVWLTWTRTFFVQPRLKWDTQPCDSVLKDHCFEAESILPSVGGRKIQYTLQSGNPAEGVLGTICSIYITRRCTYGLQPWKT